MSKFEHGLIRLRELASRERDEDYRSGLATGGRWATEHASPRQLSRLAKVVEEGCENGPGEFIGLGLENGAVQAMSDILQGQAQKRTDSRAFWSECLSEQEIEKLAEEDYYTIGFVEGALLVWREMEKNM